MRCYKHPDREGTGTCEICGKTLCDECQIHLGNQIICKSCVASLIPDNNPQEMVNEAKEKKEKNEAKTKKSLFGFLKRNKEEEKEEEVKPRTQATINQYPYGELNSPYTGEVIHEETYDYWDENETPQNLEPEFAYQDQNPLFKSDDYATQSEKPKTIHNIFRRHKMEKPEKKIQPDFEGYVAHEEIVIDHTDDEPSQLETLFVEEETVIPDSYYNKEKKLVEEFKAEAKESEAPNLNSIIIDHSDDETSQIKDYNPQNEEASLKEEMENIIDRSDEVKYEETISTYTQETNNIPKNNETQTGGETVKQLNKEEIEDLIYQLHKEGNSPSKIGIILRDQYNVPNIKAATGQKLTKIIKNKEELENKNNNDSEDISIASAEASTVINTENDDEESRPSLKPFEDVNGPQVFNYEHGAPVEEIKENITKTHTPVEKEPVKENIEEETENEDIEHTGEIVIEKTPEELELLKKIENEPEPVEIKNPTISQPKSTTTASSKVEPTPIIPQSKPDTPQNAISMQSIIDSSMFVKSYVDNYSMLPSSVRIEHKKWNMAEYLNYAVASVVNINQGINDPIPMKSLIDVLHTKDDFKFGTITKEDYLFLARIIQAYIYNENRAPFNRQSIIGTLQFKTLVYLFASVLTIYKFTNQLPETYLVNDNIFKSEDNEYKEPETKQQSQQVIPPIPTPNTVSAQTPQEPIVEPITPEPTEPQIPNMEEAPKNLIDELHKNIQDYKNQKQTDEKIPEEPIEPEEEYIIEEPRMDNGIERTTVPIPEVVDEEKIIPQENIIAPTQEENPSVSNIKRLMHNSSKKSYIDEEIEAQQTIEDLEKTKDAGVGNIKENYIDNRTRELKENPHKLTRSAQSPMPKPKEVIRGKKELIKEDLKYTPNDEKIRPRFEEEEYYENNYYEEEEDYTKMGDGLIFLISFIIFLVVFGAIAYIIYVMYFQATFGTPTEILSNLIKSM